MSDAAETSIFDLIELDPVPAAPSQGAAGERIPSTMAGICDEIRKGVTEQRWGSLMDTLRAKFGCTTYQIHQLGLPGPLRFGSPSAQSTPRPTPAELVSAERAAARMGMTIAPAAPAAAPKPTAADVAPALSPAALPLSPIADRIRRAASGETSREAAIEERRQATGSAAPRRAEAMDLRQPGGETSETAAPEAPVGADRRRVGRDMVAGAAAEASGRLFSWAGRGRLERRDILGALADAELPLDWAPPTKSAAAHLGRAVGLVALKHSLVARSVRRGALVSHRTARFDARWQIGSISGADVGQPYGSVAATVTLSTHSRVERGVQNDVETLDIEGRADVAAEIREAFAALRAGETYDAGDVTDWLRGILIRRCGGAALGVAYWVPRDSADMFERLAIGLKARRWGVSWMAPGIPVATGAQLSMGLVSGLRDELRALAAEVAAAKPGAPCKPQLEAAAVIQGRAIALGQVMGSASLDEVLTSVRNLTNAIRSRTSDVEQRFAMLELV